MNRIATTLLIALACAAGSPAAAGVPSPENSTLPACMLAVPEFPPTGSVLVRDLANNLMIGVNVVLDFTGCDAIYMCPDVPPVNFPRFAPSPVSSTTDFYGAANFNLRGGGSCLTGATVFANGVLLGTVRIVSPDQDGDGDVDAADQLLLQARIDTGDLRADLDCDGIAGPDDQTVLDYNLGASCPGATPTRSTTWGRVKQYYR